MNIFSKSTQLSTGSSWEIEPAACTPSAFQLIDIREDEEVRQESLVGLPFLHLPLSTFDPSSLDRQRPYLFFCRSGKRSHSLVSALRRQGWENVYSLKGSFKELPT